MEKPAKKSVWGLDSNNAKESPDVIDDFQKKSATEVMEKISANLDLVRIAFPKPNEIAKVTALGIPVSAAATALLASASILRFMLRGNKLSSTVEKEDIAEAIGYVTAYLYKGMTEKGKRLNSKSLMDLSKKAKDAIEGILPDTEFNLKV